MLHLLLLSGLVTLTSTLDPLLVDTVYGPVLGAARSTASGMVSILLLLCSKVYCNKCITGVSVMAGTSICFPSNWQV